MINHLWLHVLNTELQLNVNDQPIFFTHGINETPMKLLDIVFDKEFGASKVYLLNTSVLALYATEKTTRIVLNSGHDNTSCVAIVDGQLIPESIQQSPLGGKELFDALLIALMSRGFPITVTPDRLKLEEKKKEVCYVALDASAEEAKYFPRDDSDASLSFLSEWNIDKIPFDRTRFVVPELLFNLDPEPLRLKEDAAHFLFRDSELNKFPMRVLQDLV